MKKVQITADAVLAIIKGILSDEDVDVVLNDEETPPVWRGKTISQILNVDYYTYKNRPESTKETLNSVLSQNGNVSDLFATNSSFCLLEIDNIERMYSKDIDMLAMSAQLQYYVQSEKVKFIEFLIEQCNIALSGLRIPVHFGDEVRKAVIFFNRPIVSDVQLSAPFGEMVNVDVDLSIMLYPDVISYSDYTVNIGFSENGEKKNADVPLSSFSVAEIMTQDAFPGINAEQVGNINLSRALSFVLVFEGYNNAFVNYISDKTLQAGKVDNNELFTLMITRNGKNYVHTVIIKDHKTVVNADTGNETHTISFVKWGG